MLLEKKLMLFLMKIHMIVVFDPEKCRKYVKLGFVEKMGCAATDWCQTLCLMIGE